MACVALRHDSKKDHRPIDPVRYPATAQMAQRLQSLDEGGRSAA